MADLRRDDRGQLLLLAAIGLAILLVVLSLLLNALIFTDSFAQRTGPAAKAGEAVDYNHEAERAVGHLLRASNRQTGDFATLDAQFEARVATWRALSARQLGTENAVTSIETHQTEGARIAQDADRQFTSADGDRNWTLVSSTPGVRAWHMTVRRDALVESDHIADVTDPAAYTDGDVFRVVLANASHEWRVFVYQDGTSDVLLRVESPDGTLSGACRASATNGTVTVGLTNATVGGNDCAPLAALDAGGDPYEVAYRAGDEAAGTYSLVVNRTEGTVADGDLSTPGSGAPYATGAVYASRIEVGYATPSLRYDATARVAPGELR